MGPRARRRFGWIAAIFVAAVILLGAIRELTSTPQHGTAHEKAVAGAPEDLGVPFGASAAQVVRRLGQPDARRSNCWTYKVENGAQTIGSGFGQWVDYVKYCFAPGPAGGRAVSHIYSHVVAHRIGKKHYPAGWSGLVILRIPPKVVASP